MDPSSNNSSNNCINYNSPISPPSSSSLYHIPLSPPFHYEDELLLLQALFLQQEQQSQPSITPDDPEPSINNENDDKIGISQPFITNNNNPEIGNNDNQRASKKEVHGKITTAHGPRDRRMRLSLEVAREFFDLQDTLGFDKASKTVDWLLTKSGPAIREVAANLGLDYYEEECQDYYNDNANSKAKPLEKKKKEKVARARAAFLPHTKESRNKARERARERTMMKKKFDANASAGTNQQNKAGMFSQEQVVNVEEITCSQMGNRVNKQLSGTNQQSNAEIYSQELEEPEIELFSSHLNNKQLSPFWY